MQPIIRACLFLSFVLVFSSAALIDCYWHVGFDIRYVNRTGQTLCVYDSSSGAPPGVSPRGCNQLDPSSDKTYTHGYCDAPDETWWLLLTTGPGGEHIYLRSLTCEEWQDADVTITVEQTDGGFAARDSLPGLSPTPSSPSD